MPSAPVRRSGAVDWLVWVLNVESGSVFSEACSYMSTSAGQQLHPFNVRRLVILCGQATTRTVLTCSQFLPGRYTPDPGLCDW